MCDNKSVIFLSSNPISHKRAKHVDLDYHFLRELVIAGKLRTKYVPSHLQVFDLFTKSVSRPLFDFFRTKLHVCSNPTLSFRGGVMDTLPQIIYSFYFYVLCKWKYKEETLTKIICGGFVENIHK